MLVEDRNLVDHLVWERWQFINLHVSRFDALVTVTNVSPTLLWMMVPVGWWKTSNPLCHRPSRIERGMEPTGGLEPPAFSLPRECWTTISHSARC
jgi:hypothetical protein